MALLCHLRTMSNILKSQNNMLWTAPDTTRPGRTSLGKAPVAGPCSCIFVSSPALGSAAIETFFTYLKPETPRSRVGILVNRPSRGEIQNVPVCDSHAAERGENSRPSC
jgi:hypothetical protein